MYGNFLLFSSRVFSQERSCNAPAVVSNISSPARFVNINSGKPCANKTHTHTHTNPKEKNSEIQKFRKEKTKNKNSHNVHSTRLSSKSPEPNCSVFLSSKQKAQILKKRNGTFQVQHTIASLCCQKSLKSASSFPVSVVLVRSIPKFTLQPNRT